MIRQSNLMSLFGYPNEGTWAALNMKMIDLGEFKDKFGHVLDFNGAPWKFKIYAHKLMEEPLKKAFSLLVERGVARELKTYDGCFNIRHMKGSNRLSVHSWGMAVDFNADTNPFRSDGELITDFSDEFVKCFLEAGFEWGGDWSRPVDPMHFQLPRTGV